MAQIVAEFLANHDPHRECGWVARLDGERVGSIFCVCDAEDGSGHTAKLRLFLLEPSARGTGLSKRLIETCLQFARDAGYQHMRLWTHASHEAACRLYEKYGFTLSKSWDEHTFGQDVVSQIWERAL